jgi:hypothetical protein
MKTQRTLIRSALGIFVSGIFAAAALAGPGPQYWNRPAATSAKKPDAQKIEAPVAGKCAGCTTSPIWGSNNREPGGKGAPSARVVGSTHSCARCTGSVATQNGKVKDGMTHDVGCGPLLCCK